MQKKKPHKQTHLFNVDNLMSLHICIYSRNRHSIKDNKHIDHLQKFPPDPLIGLLVDQFVVSIL